MKPNIFENPFSEHKQRKDDDVGLARLLLGEEAAKEMARVSSPSKKQEEQVNWDLGITEKERNRGKANLEKNPQYLLEQAKVIFGEDFHGKEAIETAFGIKLQPKDIPPFPYSLKDLEKTKELKEQGIEEMCVLFVSSIEGKPLTGKLLNTLIQKKYEEMGLGYFIFGTDEFRIRTEEFYTQPVLKLEWKILTKQCIPDSKNKRHHWKPKWKREATQAYAIEQFAIEHNIPRTHLHRPELVEMLYVIALHLIETEKRNGKGKGERLLEHEAHWSDTGFSRDSSLPICVGKTDRTGAHLEEKFEDGANQAVGVCLSRAPSLVR